MNRIQVIFERLLLCFRVAYISQGVTHDDATTGTLNDTSFNTPFSFNLSNFDVTIYRHIPPGRYYTSVYYVIGLIISLAEYLMMTN